MLIRPVREDEKQIYNQVVQHPLQSWEWGEFRKQTGVNVERIGFFEHGKMKKGLQVTFHIVPKINRAIGYYPKGFMPDAEQLSVLRQLAEKHHALFIKLEPDIAAKVDNPSGHQAIGKFLLDNGCKPGKPLFTKYTFHLNLTKDEEKLFANLASKTRYNVRKAIKSGVQIVENTSDEGMKQYLEILKETTKRQGFYAHSPDYFQKMWSSLGKSGMMRIFNAIYQGQILVSWIMFVFGDTLYYPYGSSRSAHREVMASNLMMWEMIRFGKSLGLKSFDMWGSLGPDANKKDKWFGFHRFKKGYGGDLMEFLGTYDLIIDQPMYQIFKFIDDLRWKWLRFKAKLGL